MWHMYIQAASTSVNCVLYTSPLIMELIIDENDNIHVIEAVPEFGGEFIPDILIPARTGYNFLREVIKASTSQDFNLPALKKSKDTVIVKYITGGNGTLIEFNPAQPKRISGVIFSRIFKDIGSKINIPITNHDRIGVVVAKGRKREEAIEIARTAENYYNIIINED